MLTGALTRTLENKTSRMLMKIGGNRVVQEGLHTMLRPLVRGVANGIENVTTLMMDSMLRATILNESNVSERFSEQAMESFGTSFIVGTLYGLRGIKESYRQIKMGSALVETAGGVEGLLDGARSLEKYSASEIPGLKGMIRAVEADPNVYTVGALASKAIPHMYAQLRRPENVEATQLAAEELHKGRFEEIHRLQLLLQYLISGREESLLPFRSQKNGTFSKLCVASIDKSARSYYNHLMVSGD